MDSSAPNGPYAFGPYTLDASERILRKNGAPVTLTPTLIEILLVLVEARGRLVTREDLIERVWPDRFVEEGNLSRNVSFLRKCLDDDVREPRFIQTIPRRGYRMVAEVRGPGEDALPPQAPKLDRFSRRAILAAVSLGGVAVAGRFLAGSSGESSISSVVVLPLQSLSDGEQGEMFADGVTEALITDLGRIRALKVISRTTARSFKKTSKTLPEIARELDVEAVVEGFVQLSGSKVRITVRLVEAATDREIWSETHEQELADVLALQRQVARAIARRIQVEVLPEEERLLAAEPSRVDPEAHGFYVRGLSLRSMGTADSYRQAVPCFEQAIEKDPTLARAYAELGEIYLLRGTFLGPVNDDWPIARKYAEKALEIDETLSEAYVLQASLSLWLNFDQTTAKAQLERTLRFNPGCPYALNRYSYTLASMGLFEEAVSRARRAVELEPLSSFHHATLYRALYFAGRYAEAENRIAEVLELFPKSVLLREVRGLVAVRAGEAEKAVEFVQDALALGGGAGTAELLVYCMAAAGRKVEAVAKGEELLRSERRPGMGFYGQAMLHAGLADSEATLDWFEKACRGRDYRLVVANVDPIWVGVRAASRFRGLTAALGLIPVSGNLAG